MLIENVIENLQKHRNAFGDDDNNGFFGELSDQEASVIAGGFSITNDTNKNLAFYSFGETQEPQRHILASGQKGNFAGDYILYDSTIGPGYVPVTQQLGDGSYRFSNRNNRLSILGVTANKIGPAK
jgi:hypothetical protein